MIFFQRSHPQFGNAWTSFPKYSILAFIECFIETFIELRNLAFHRCLDSVKITGSTLVVQFSIILIAVCFSYTRPESLWPPFTCLILDQIYWLLSSSQRLSDWLVRVWSAVKAVARWFPDDIGCWLMALRGTCM